MIDVILNKPSLNRSQICVRATVTKYHHVFKPTVKYQLSISVVLTFLLMS